MPSVTLGKLSVGGFSCYTLERPWNNNIVNISCIPEGYYSLTRVNSPSYGATYAIAVPGRSSILVRPANWVHQLRGCIALGQYVDPKDYDYRGAMVGSSRAAYRDFLAACSKDTNHKIIVRSHRPDFYTTH